MMTALASGVLPALVGWLLTYALHSTLLLCAVWGITRAPFVRERGADILWKAALLGGLATATLRSVVEIGPALNVPTAAAPIRMKQIQVVERRPGAGEPVVRRWSEPLQRGSRNPAGVLAVALTMAWVLGAAVRLAGLGRAHLRLRRCLAGRRELPAGELTRLARSLAGEVRITVSDLLPVPVALGRAEICLPRRVLEELTPGQQQGVVAHEAAHLVRRDPFWLALLGVVKAVLFFQPLNALGLRRYREGAELLCDDRAVRATGRPRDLARSIASIAGWLSAPAGTVPLAAMVEHASPLVRRVHRLVGVERSGGDIHAWRAGAFAALLLLTLVIAGAPSASVHRPIPKLLQGRRETIQMRAPNGHLLRVVRTQGDPLPVEVPATR